MIELIITLLYIVFVVSAIVLIVVVLIQEGKGGGLGMMLGEHGQQTFGVGAKGINQFTGYTAGVFLVSAILIHILTRQQELGSVVPGLEPLPGQPVQGPPPAGPGGGAGGGGGGQDQGR